MKTKEYNLRETNDAAIEGVRIVGRKVFHQYGRGHFSEMVRTDDLDELDIKQWSASSMLRGSVKGFHIHPYCGGDPKKEQWDVMFFLTSTVEVLLKDERPGNPKTVMRIIIDGDSTPSENNKYIIIPAGVAHAIRNIGRDDLIMVYGTTTVFDPKNEGRIAEEPEMDRLPDEWEQYLKS